MVAVPIFRPHFPHFPIFFPTNLARPASLPVLRERYN